MTRVAAPTVRMPGSSRVQSSHAIRGVLLILFGLVEGGLLLFAFRIPHITAHDIMIILAVFLLADGAVALMEAAGAEGGAQAVAACSALAGLAAGVAILVGGSAGGLRYFPLWAIVIGVLELVSRRFLLAVASLAFGLFALVGPVQD